VRHAPFLLVLVSREQGRPREVPHVGQRRLVDLLEEPRLVADLGHQVRVVDEDLLDAGDVQAEDALGELLGQLAEVRGRVGAGDLRGVAEDRDPTRGPDGTKAAVGSGVHGVAPS
jgi:hypothetical protein